MEKLTKHILTSASYTADGVTPEQLVSFEKVLDCTTLQDQQRSNSGKTLDKIRVLLDDGTETDWYCLSLWWAGGDDADDWINLFDDLAKAQKVYNDYK
ncbi:hypothetical protein [Arsenicibacter rosenii]|uniref:Uncharacterized protein n=1 Tax=Arsenicibacter rosenii TaxID=1750698 RepID=A0A1S2VAI0_9BACT|nr:hypothetical protein [Arsenicibacter rosenii]OIN55734.1 hypothetical protein BLX24_28375 [Arsenicibacter rosenii]